MVKKKNHKQTQKLNIGTHYDNENNNIINKIIILLYIINTYIILFKYNFLN